MQPEDRVRSLRSLDRKRMYTIFAPLDANERLPRELLLEGKRFRLFGGAVGPQEYAVGRRELAGLLWLPALGLVLLLAGWARVEYAVALGAALLLFAGFWAFVRLGDRKGRLK